MRDVPVHVGCIGLSNFNCVIIYYIKLLVSMVTKTMVLVIFSGVVKAAGITLSTVGIALGCYGRTDYFKYCRHSTGVLRPHGLL